MGFSDSTPKGEKFKRRSPPSPRSSFIDEGFFGLHHRSTTNIHNIPPVNLYHQIVSAIRKSCKKEAVQYAQESTSTPVVVSTSGQTG